MKTYLISALMLLSFMTQGCKNEEYAIVPQKESGLLNISVQHVAGSTPLIFDSMLYQNKAGNKFSVTRLQYYLSSIQLYYMNRLVAKTDSIYYIDASSGPSNITIPVLNTLAFDSIAFTVGIDAPLNISNSLPPTYANTEMIWPDAMGGGYHFLKLEGHWKSSLGISGYAVHLGRNTFQIQAGDNCYMEVQQGKTSAMALVMNVYEWFESPHVYDIEKDGNYTMGSATLMRKVSDNGQNAFHVEY
jgi:hypothetical protein